MGNICCLLDACSVINLIYIDEDDFLIEKIKFLESPDSKSIELHIHETVFDEIKRNVKKPLEVGNNNYSNKQNIESFKKEIDQKIGFFRGKLGESTNLIQSLGQDIYSEVQEMTEYRKKNNGELCSTVYALYLSRLNERMVNFYTDDLPAKQSFLPFFESQQIGHIKDSIDFLILIYWLDADFTPKQLDDILSELHSLYATETIKLHEDLQKYYDSEVDARYRKSNKEPATKLKNLIDKLRNFDFSGIMELWNYFKKNNRRCRKINNILKKYKRVFEAENEPNKETILDKISRTRNSIAKKKIYKWNDLMAS